VTSSYFQNQIEAERTPIQNQWGDPFRITESSWHTDRKRLPNAFQKWRREWDRCLHTSRVMAAERPYGEFYGFYSGSTEYFG
jgi:hypothetical protein